MKSLLVSNKFMLTIIALTYLAGFGCSFYFNNFDWLSRFGALVVCWGIILMARPNIAGSEIGQTVIAHDSELSLDDPEYYKLRGEAVPDWAIENVLSRRAVGIYGPLACFLGTLTNGFAGLLNELAGFLVK